VLMTKF